VRRKSARVGVDYEDFNLGEAPPLTAGGAARRGNSSNRGTAEPWHSLRLHPTSDRDGREGSLLLFPPPRKALRHAFPLVLEGVVGPLVVFYVFLVLTGLKGALIAALAWSYLALGRLLLKRERVIDVVVVVVVRNDPLHLEDRDRLRHWEGLLLLCSTHSRYRRDLSRPLGRSGGRSALHATLCPRLLPYGPGNDEAAHGSSILHSDLGLWATVMMLNAGLAFWLLVSSSLRSFVLERSGVSYGLTAIAIFFSMTWFMAMMRHDGITVEWAST
jgi:hypothetical protein